MALVVFDIDNTLLSGQSHRYFLRFLRREKVIGIRVYFITTLWFVFYKFGLVRRPEAVMNYALKFISGWEAFRLEALVRRFLDEELKKHFYRQALDSIREHAAKGDNILLVSNLIEPIARAIGSSVGVKDVISTALEMKNGRYTGRISGNIVYGTAKLHRVSAFAEERGLSLTEAWAYGDHPSDFHLLEKTGHPVLVNPSRYLQRVARDRGWRTLRFET